MGITVLASFDCTTLVMVTKKLWPHLKPFIPEMNTCEETAAYCSEKVHVIFIFHQTRDLRIFAISFNLNTI